MDLKDMGLKIKFLRQSKGLTQKELAEKIGTTWEMVSRYETGKSSPLGRIDKIAHALGTHISKILGENTLAEGDSTYTPNSLPLLNKDFNDIHKALEQCKIYYTAPNWIIEKYLQPFCIDASILEIQTTQIDPNGIIFAVQQKPSSQKDLVIIRSSDKDLIITTKNNVPSKAKILATAVAWEKRFK
jgi:transcriptional regulator with XRE-family HTH domain